MIVFFIIALSEVTLLGCFKHFFEVILIPKFLTFVHYIFEKDFKLPGIENENMTSYTLQP